MNIDWKRKLTSRKWWIAVATFIVGLVIAFGGSGELANTITGCVMSLASAIAYTLSEGFIDAENVKSQNQADVMKGMTDMITSGYSVTKENQNGE